MSESFGLNVTAGEGDRREDPLAEWTIVPTVEALRQKLPELAAAYRHARPYPHLVLDDFLPSPVAATLADRFPAPTDARVWTRLPTDDQRGKSSLRHESALPVAIRRLIHELNSHTMIEFLEDLSGITGLLSDPRLVGGGIHQTHAGGKLSVHIDYSHHPQYQLYRRMNLILYLSPAWKEEYGGHFELWDERATACQARVLPAFNRCVVFSTSDRSYHGQPEPLSCPPDRQRNSVALYYYTNEAAGMQRSEPSHNTLFRSRPGETAPLCTRIIRAASGGLLQDLLPPICYRAIRRIWNRPR
jgi:Rps23 Pro-64 3,4-dihydroxylase Tpa1-like proline 4-hydroxylase